MQFMPITPPGSEFQSFLYAPICQCDEGMILTVLSAIARQDLDPWSEAARLSQLPEETAVKQITRLLDALPHQKLADFDRAAVAARLSALLPRGTGLDLSDILPGPVTVKDKAAAFTLNWRFLCICVCLMLLMNWLTTRGRVPLPAADGLNAPSVTVGTSLPTSTDTRP